MARQFDRYLLTAVAAILLVVVLAFDLAVINGVAEVALGVAAVALIRASARLRNKQRRLATAERRFERIAEAMPDVFWMATVDMQKILYVSPAFERVWGRKPDEDWRSAIHEADRARLMTTLAGGASDGQILQFRIVRPDGTIRWIYSKTYVRDGVAIGVASDVTEKHTLEEQIRQTQKLESIGLLAGGVAHDFNNVLGVVSANASMLAEDLAKHPSLELVDEIQAAVERATGLTRQLLAFSRKQVVEPVVLDLNHMVNETRRMLRRLVGADIAVRTSLDPEAGRIRFDAGHLTQILMNLAVNARDAMPRGGALTIETRARQGTVILAVRDTGTGMPPEVVRRVFEPFFTTKPVGRGTGLGLSVVHGIVEQAGGRVAIESTVGAGTTIEIELPSTREAALAIPRAEALVSRGDEKIILVDDDTYLRTAASRALRSRGYAVIEASDGASALEALAEHADDTALVITDVVMPGMDGAALAEAVRTEWPGLPVLFTSGYTDDEVVRHGVLRAEVPFVEKPYSTSRLAEKVRQVLDNRLSMPSIPFAS